MSLKKCTEAIFEANVKGLNKGHNYLLEKGIHSVHTHPTGEELGLLKVAPEHAEIAKAHLADLERGRIL